MRTPRTRATSLGMHQECSKFKRIKLGQHGNQAQETLESCRSTTLQGADLVVSTFCFDFVHVEVHVEGGGGAQELTGGEDLVTAEEVGAGARFCDVKMFGRGNFLY